MTAAERSILTRVSHDAWAAWCRRTGMVPPYALPPLYGPVSRHKALDLLAQDTSADDAHRRRFKQNVASLYALGGENAHHELDSVLGKTLDRKGLGRLHELEAGACRCCHAARALDESGSIWHLVHRYSNATVSTFDPKTQVTKIRSTYQLSTAEDPSDEQVDEIVSALAEQLDPRNWSRDKDSSFKRSEPIEVDPRSYGGEHWYDGKLDWAGKLIESFEWDWNPDASMAMDNLLNVDFKVTRREVNLDYSLDQSLSSKLWLARQAGGLDIDRGTCRVKVLGRKALKVEDPSHPPDVVPIEVARIPKDEEFHATDHFNIVVITTKTERFTPVQFAPSWFSTLINYQTPVLGGIWMSQAVQSGILRAIAATGSGQVTQLQPTDMKPLKIAI